MVHRTSSSRVLCLSPWFHALSAEEMGVRLLFAQHKAWQGSASTAEGHEAHKSTESTQILVGETWLLEDCVRDKENREDCAKSIAMDLVSLFCCEKVFNDYQRCDEIVLSVSTR